MIPWDGHAIPWDGHAIHEAIQRYLRAPPTESVPEGSRCDAAAERLRAEHGIVGAWDGDDLVLSAGTEALLPPWPPVVNLPGLCVPIQGVVGDVEQAVCAGCGTAIARREHEWRHEEGLTTRDGCMGRPAGAIDDVRAADCSPTFPFLAADGVAVRWPLLRR